ncbi:EF-hand domain-containing protein [Sphingomonas xanthus]|uniref:EF-hand domain-containing protein n=1 Tax=Sphingomonas xanthus TaxID=2594473 RepID=A0A516IRG3_9SPHN|nr:EF-hand domain-containing protein [Sphingomonas xanthus]QDP19490.1 hypothetical protein FMM02_05645 [Sphingomonas xanthus]
MFILLTAAALAQGTAPTAPKPVTKVELGAKLDSDYADLDSDKDGKVGAEEIKARLVKSAEEDIATLEKERDAAFARFDSNGDGTISRVEFDERAKLPTLKDPDPKPFLERFDANKDGAISADEFRAPTLANFDRLDSNKDGTLSPAEQQASARAPAKAPASVSASKGAKPKVKETPPIGR